MLGCRCRLNGLGTYWGTDSAGFFAGHVITAAYYTPVSTQGATMLGSSGLGHYWGDYSAGYYPSGVMGGLFGFTMPAGGSGIYYGGGGNYIGVAANVQDVRTSGGAPATLSGAAIAVPTANNPQVGGVSTGAMPAQSAPMIGGVPYGTAPATAPATNEATAMLGNVNGIGYYYSGGGYYSGAGGAYYPSTNYSAPASPSAPATQSPVPISVYVTPSQFGGTAVPSQVDVTPSQFGGTAVPTSIAVTPPVTMTAPGAASPTVTQIQQAIAAGMSPTDWTNLTPEQQAIMAGVTPTQWAAMSLSQQMAALYAAGGAPPVYSPAAAGSGRLPGGGGSGARAGGGGGSSGGGSSPPPQPKPTAPATGMLTGQVRLGNGTILPAGSIIHADGSVTLPNGTIMPAGTLSSTTPGLTTTAPRAATLTSTELAAAAGYTPAQFESMTPAQKIAALQSSGIDVTGYTGGASSQLSAALGSLAHSKTAWIIGGAVLLMLMSGKSAPRQHHHEERIIYA